MSLPFATGWELAIQLAKLLEYAGIAAISGGTVCLLFFRDNRRQSIVLLTAYIGICSLLGFNGALFAFLFQIGMTSGSGLGGMFDPDMARMLLGFETGAATLLRLAGFLLATIACAIFARHLGARPPPQLRYHILGATQAFALLLVAVSFTITGHIAVLGLAAKAAIIMHLLAMGVWIGAFAPLLYLCLSSEGETLVSTMKGFGDMAGYCLAALFAAGLVLVFALFHTPRELISTPYGLTLLIKLALVGGLLLVAAGNRFLLVPKMLAGAGPASLARSIRIEILISAAILAVTSYLATTVGPPAMPM